jgi:TPR repeat protein
MGNLLHQGVLFRKDVSEAYRCYQKAAERGERDGYYGMVLIDEERGETEKARQDYAFALEAGFLLPGTVE